jgi:hypothetical protein
LAIDGEAPAVELLPFPLLPQVVRDRVAPLFATKRGVKVPDEVVIGFDLPLPEGAHLNRVAAPAARAVALLESYRDVWQATHTGRVTLRPNLPLDVLGVYVLMPVPKGLRAGTKLAVRSDQ